MMFGMVPIITTGLNAVSVSNGSCSSTGLTAWVSKASSRVQPLPGCCAT